jgi:hypothetical protein
VQAFVVRVWVPDRPGALGQIASRIGAVRGDVIGIEILERGAGRAIDELVVALPEADLLSLLATEIGQVDGVKVEDIRPVVGERHDPAIGPLEIATRLAGAGEGLLQVLVDDVAVEFDADWVIVVHAGPPPQRAAGHGDAPSTAWLAAFVEGARHLSAAALDGAPDDIAWAPLGGGGTAVVLGRKGRPMRWRERRQLTELGRLAGALLARSASVLDHPVA